jgi:hypothetical protein
MMNATVWDNMWGYGKVIDEWDDLVEIRFDADPWYPKTYKRDQIVVDDRGMYSTK